MPDALTIASGGVTGWLLTYLVHSSLLIAGAWVLSSLIRLSPQAGDVLWKTALVGGFVTTTAVTLTSHPGQRLHVMGLRTSASGVDATWRSAGARPLSGAKPSRAAFGARSARPPAQIRARRIESVGPSMRVSWSWGFFVIWGLGACGLLTGQLVRRRGLRRVLGELERASERTRTILTELKRGGHSSPPAMRRIAAAEVRSTRRLGSPCVVAPGVIAIPKRCERDLTDQELRAVLAHELGHVARRDLFWSELLRTLSRMLWIQPLNRYALERIRQGAELICDDWATARTGERYGLASSICRVAEWLADDAGVQRGVPMVGCRGHRLSERVRRVLTGSVGRREPAWVGSVVAAFLIVPMYWAPVVRGPVVLTAAVVVEREIQVRAGEPPPSVTRRVYIPGRLPEGR